VKKIILSILLLFSIKLVAQTSDIVYVSDNSIFVTYKPTKVGIYLGATAQTSFPAPNIYTTPYVNFRHIGIDLTLIKDVSIMFGSQVENGILPFEYNPEFWIKVRLLSTLRKNEDKWDVTLMLNVPEKLYWGVGICIPLS
jgi:hypothetical protein